GKQPEVEMARFLTEKGFEHTPAFLGSIEHRPVRGGEPTVMAAAFAFVANQGNAWEFVTGALQRDLEDLGMQKEAAEPVVEEAPPFSYPLAIGELLGRRTAELHRALAASTDDPDFATTRITSA